MSEVEALMAEVHVVPVTGTACSRPSSAMQAPHAAKPRKCKMTGAVEAQAGAAARAGC